MQPVFGATCWTLLAPFDGRGAVGVLVPPLGVVVGGVCGFGPANQAWI